MFLHKHFSANNVAIEKFPFMREIAMEAYLIENETILSLETEGFNEVSIVESEVTLIDGRSGKSIDGRIDILAKYGQEYIAIVELKKGMLTEMHLSQLEDYLKERSQILTRFPTIWDSSIGSTPKWIGIMIGETIDPDLMQKIRKGYYYDPDIPIAALTINRYRGNDGNVYVVADTYFVERVKNKDYTKYLFNGEILRKNRLVLAVIKNYVQNHPTISFSQLEVVFPQSLQGKETFADENKARAVFQQSGRKRHFFEPDELITLSDTTIAVSTQWGISNINRFIKHSNDTLKSQIEIR
jgi:hypothetical protein